MSCLAIKGASQSLQAKLDYGSSLCAKFHERSVKQIKNNISQCKIAKTLGLSPYTIHNIVKRFRESREITVHVGQGRKPQLNVLDLWALRWHCIRNRHAAVLNISTWAQEYFRKPLSFTTVCCCIKKCNLNLCYSRRKLYMLRGSLGQSSSQIVKKTVEMCSVLRWVHMSTCFWEKWMVSSQSHRPKGPSTLSSATEAKSNVCHGMGVQQSKQHRWLGYVWRYYWDGGIYWDCKETYTAIKMMSFMGSPWLLYQDNASSPSACATTALFRRDRVNVLDWPADLSPIENVWLIIKRRIRQQQSQTAELLKSCIKRDWTKI